VSGCRLKSNQGAIKFGTESVADFDNIKITNCQIRDTKNGGIKLLSADGARLQNVTISEITMENVATPIFVRLGARLKTFRPEDKKGQAGLINNVVIKNVRARAAAKAQIMPPSGIFITGIPGHPVGKLTLENIEIELAGGGEREQGRQVLQENVDGYPEINRFGPRLPAFGLYARHVKGLQVTGLTVKLGVPDLRPALVCQDCEDSEFAEWKLPADAGAESLVRLESAKRVRVKGFEVTGDAGAFVRVEGKDSEGIRLSGNRIGGTAKATELSEDVTPGAVVR
jgi:polygalacturonase